MLNGKQNFGLRKHCPICRHEIQQLVVWSLLWHGQAECDRCGCAIRYMRSS
jgi:hypothetical protein